MVYRYSDDSGATWAAEANLAVHTAGGTQPTAAGRGDSALLYDPDGGTSGRVWAFYNYSPPGIGYSNSDNTNTVGSTTTLHPYARYSDDNGATWSAEQDLIASIKDTTMWGSFVVGGHGSVLPGGVLTVPLTYAVSSGGASASYLAYSTDHGATWAISSKIVTLSPGEHHVVARSDGQRMMVGRPSNGNGRIVATASSITGTWTSSQTLALPDPSCNSDLLRVDPGDLSSRASWLLAVGCASSAVRANLTVQLSKDNGATWPHAWQVYKGGAAYSTLVRLADGSFGLFWENTDAGAMQYTPFDLSVFDRQVS